MTPAAYSDISILQECAAERAEQVALLNGIATLLACQWQLQLRRRGSRIVDDIMMVAPAFWHFILAPSATRRVLRSTAARICKFPAFNCIRQGSETQNTS